MRSAFQHRLGTLAQQLGAMCAMAGEAIGLATEALLKADLVLAERVIAGQADLIAVNTDVEETAFALLALQAPVAADLRAVVSAIRIAADAQRMGGLAVHVAEIARMRHPQNAVPDDVRGHIAEMGRLAEQLAGGAREVLLAQDPGRAAQIRRDDDAMDELHHQLQEVLRDPRWTHGVVAAVDVTLLGRFYERFADHAVQIARRIIFQATGR
ncbi:phosphate signaling complex protein PhoU [Mycobacterium sp. SMC-2]|uniref:phosphate signaling complex protein PhoU n=1 Tax=Mycobacterium sp. SMC-2 TaxID=2857058 RepID=UPI0021B1B474|nr:phosphate signaling complex protein PhoU [Mycobacterium sp. SMC-2]UXA07165.1 phosphate signaling complex protein PhoU [Mycobacterium sp. SMC-2]